MKYTYNTKGTCSRQILIELDENGTIISAEFVGGCHGNTQGLSALVRGQDAADVAKRLRGINCGRKGTSCPDQLSLALEAGLAHLKEDA